MGDACDCESVLVVLHIKDQEDNIELMREARSAYCPYSRFRVGAAVLCTDGSIVRGCKIENASYGLTICAERTAIFSAVAQCKTPVACIASAYTDPDTLKIPCGACRQVIAEFLLDDALVHVAGVGTMTVGELLPRAFRL